MILTEIKTKRSRMLGRLSNSISSHMISTSIGQKPYSMYFLKQECITCTSDRAHHTVVGGVVCARQGARLVLSALALRLMDLLSSREFRQSSITDPVVYGRKLRAWQVRAGTTPHTYTDTHAWIFLVWIQSLVSIFDTA